MLGLIKKKFKGWIAYAVIGIITIPFAMFGIQSYFQSTNNPTIATVDGQDITSVQYIRLFTQESRRLQQELGENYNSEIEKRLKIAVVNLLIDNILLDEFAKDAGLAVVTEEILLAINNNNQFYVDEVFSNELYQRLLARQGISPSEYELDQQKILIRDQIRNNLLDSNLITDAQVKQLTELDNQQRKLSYIVIKDDDFVNQIVINENQVLDYYENNKEQFLSPFQIKVNFVELIADQVVISDNFTDDDLLSIYDDNIALFVEKEKRKAQHILVDDKSLATSLLEKINAGEDFAEIAKLNSIDTGTKDKGGDLGYFEIGVMVPEFEDVVFSLDIGEVSKVIQSDYGYHIIKLNDVIAKNTKSFVDVREELEDIYRNREKSKELNRLQEEFANVAYEQTIDDLAREFSLDLQSSEFFTINSDLYDPIFVNSAYSDVVLVEGYNSDVLKIGDNFIVLNLADTIEQKQKTFVEVKDEINDILRKEKLTKFVDDLSAKLVTSLSYNSEYANNFIADNNLKWSDYVWVNRNSDMPFSITKIAYKIPKPINNNSVYVSQRVDYSNTLLLELKDIKQVATENNKQIGRIYSIQELNEWFKSFVKSLRDEADIEIFENLL